MIEETAEGLAKKQGIRELSKFKPFMYLLLARIVSRFGDSIDAIAYSWMVYMMTGSKILMGTLFALNFVPGILFSVFTGALVDRWPKRLVVLIAYLGRGMLVLITAWLFWIGALRPWHLYVLTLLNSTLECFASPAETALVPSLLPKEQLLSANSVSSSVCRIAELAGLAIAGGMISFIGISGAILIDSLTFLSAALFIGLIRGLDSTEARISDASTTSLIEEIKTGLKFMSTNKLILTIMLTAAYVNLCLAPYNVLNPVYVKEILNSGPQGLSALGISLICGMIASGLWISRKGSQYKKSTLIITGYLLLCINYALLFVAPFVKFNAHLPLVVAAIFSFGIGCAVSLVSTPTATYFMEEVPKELLGRIGSLNGMLATCAIPIGSLIAGFAGEWIPVHYLYLSFGLLLLLPILFLIRQRSFLRI